jgi:hypothetical protein
MSEQHTADLAARICKRNAQSAVDTLKDITGSAGAISDGYHTFDELYAHRIALFRVTCRALSLMASQVPYIELEHEIVWKSQVHSDGSIMEGWFIMGIDSRPGKQITYHLPMSEWDNCKFANTLEKAPEWDGHTSADVLKRLAEL